MTQVLHPSEASVFYSIMVTL